MIRRLKLLLQEAFVEIEVVDESSALQLACASLMFEVLRADYEIHPAELEKIGQHIRQAFDLSESDTQFLMRLANEKTEQMVSLHDVLRTINEAYAMDEKRELLEMLWSVAYADGELDRHEEYAIRKLADLLHIPHRDFIRTKHQAEADSGI